jgi:hypothetical protein
MQEKFAGGTAWLHLSTIITYLAEKINLTKGEKS